MTVNISLKFNENGVKFPEAGTTGTGNYSLSNLPTGRRIISFNALNF